MNVIEHLISIFIYFPQPIMFYCDQGHHYNNDDIKKFFKTREIVLVLSSFSAFKSIKLIERENKIFKKITVKNKYD